MCKRTSGDYVIGTMAALRDLTGTTPTVHSYPDCTVYMVTYGVMRVGVVVPRDEPEGYDITVFDAPTLADRLAVCETVIRAMDAVLAD